MTDTSATWNDERVEQLKKLWAEGKSASQIAAEIGGISRNAVIGKVHRLGLAGRPKAGSAGGSGRNRPGNGEMQAGDPAVQGAAPASAEPAASAQKAPDEAATERADRRAGSRAAASGNTFSARIVGAASAGNGVGAGAQREGSGAADPAPRGGTLEAVPETEQHVTIMELREGMCRWPIGDPTSAEFRFCGARADIGVPYCSHHARIAYQPAADRRRERKAANG